MTENILYYGDNLDILRRYIKDETIDLVYLDPPFKSNQDYNVLFAEQDGTRAAAQIKAFEDTWQWDQAAAAAWQEVVEAGGRVSQVMQAFRTFLGDNDMLAYLSMMAPRLVELQRVLKPTGSLYLHCDPTASHYIRLLLDAIFGARYFQNEIIWKRTSARSDSHRFNHIHDTIFFYSKSEKFTWNTQYMPYDESYIDGFYRHTEPGTKRRFRLSDLTAAGTRKGESGGPIIIKGKKVYPSPGRHWALGLKPEESVQQAVDRLVREKRIWYESGKMPAYKRYLDEMPGVPGQSIWTDILPISAQAKERLGYPTQKPEALMERIISASSNKGDLVLDPFCGCGTTIATAQKLNRRWIGIDITHLAITLIKHRLWNAFGDKVVYEVIGEPVSLPDAEALAAEDPYQFQWWALGLVGARPVEQKKGADKGIDGRLYFHDEPQGGKTKQIVLSIKAGHTNAPHVRDLRGVLEREKAEIGVLITMQEPSHPMRAEAAGAGFYKSSWGQQYPRLQVLTIAELLDGKRIDYPPPTQTNVTFKKAQRLKAEEGEQLGLVAEEETPYRAPAPALARRGRRKPK